MIGLLNVPCDTPAEYYSASPNQLLKFKFNPCVKFDLTNTNELKNLKMNKSTINCDTNMPDLMLIFKQNQLKKINYLDDDRQMHNRNHSKVVSNIQYLTKKNETVVIFCYF